MHASFPLPKSELCALWVRGGQWMSEVDCEKLLLPEFVLAGSAVS